MRFQTLFTVDISHEYYTQGCQDFGFSFPQDALRLLKRGRLITRVQSGKLYVLFDMDNADIRISGEVLRIGLKLLNPFFSNFTSATSLFSYYRNSPEPTVLSLLKSRALVGSIFSHTLQAVTLPVKVDLRNADNLVLRSDEFTASNKQSSIAYDLTGQPVGAYQIVEGGRITDYYYDSELIQQSIFGVIEIKVQDSLYNTPSEFKIRFTAKEEILKYYVIAKNYNADGELDKISVTDERKEANLSKINFVREFPVEDSITRIFANDPSLKTILFKSQVNVKRQENARQKIQLTVDGQAIIPHLPQPSADRPNSDLIIQLTKPQG